MIYLVLGITIILTALFPIGWQLSMSLYRMMAHMGAPNHSYLGAVAGIVGAVSAYLPAYVVAKIFVVKSRLAARISSPVPGLAWVKTGVIVVIIYRVARALAKGIPGGETGYLVASFEQYLWLMYIFILVGITKALLAAGPRVP
ncbi:MAG: hypothetical protein Q7U16_13665 [Agitococcus sp.]|nr:hypothetical protein [Agitococcus sp.]